MNRSAKNPLRVSPGPTVVARSGEQSEDIYEEEIPPVEWGSEYKKRRSYSGQSYEGYESSIGKN
jgi:hypothetical protein